MNEGQNAGWSKYDASKKSNAAIRKMMEGTMTPEEIQEAITWAYEKKVADDEEMAFLMVLAEMSARHLDALESKPTSPTRLSEMEAHLEDGGKFHHENAVELLVYLKAESGLVKELVAALKPFAKAYETWSGGNAQHHFSHAVTPADFLRAFEARAKAKPTAQEPKGGAL